MSNHVGSIQIGIPNIYVSWLDLFFQCRFVCPISIQYPVYFKVFILSASGCHVCHSLLQVRVCMYVLRPDQSVFWISSDSLSRSVGLWRLIYLSRPLCLYYGNLYGCPDLSILRRLICFSVQIYLFYGDLSICPDLTVLWRSFSMSVHFGLSMEIA
jgi:hypothetical protein